MKIKVIDVSKKLRRILYLTILILSSIQEKCMVWSGKTEVAKPCC